MRHAQALGAAILLLLSRAALAAADEEKQVPCYNCKTDRCPDLEAPRCEVVESKPANPESKPPKPHRKHPRPSAQPAEPEAALPAPAPPSPPLEEPAPPAAAITAPAPAPPAAEVVVAPPLTRAPAREGPRFRGAAIGSGAGGLLLVGAGAVLLAIDRRYGTECWMPGNVNTCMNVYQTLPAGAALVGVGAAALVGASALFVMDWRRKGRAQHPRLEQHTP